MEKCKILNRNLVVIVYRSICCLNFKLNVNCLINCLIKYFLLFKNRIEEGLSYLVKKK